ncbi:MAG: hypothetical protein II393_03550 [Cytophagales bacterium]|nr:hypothetical protein [Cytophagales bacterium]
MFYPFLPPNCNKPPTLYSVLNSIVNGDKDEDEYTKIKDLAKEGRSTIFNFDYPLSEYIEKEKFETMILNHFLQRRIGFETVTAFRIQLDVKLNEIMPLYNKMFNALDNWEIFNDGEVTTRTGTDNTTTQNTNNTSNSLTNQSTTSTTDVSDRRNSELPQNQLSELRDGNYVTNYNYDTNTNNGQDNSTSQGTSQATNNGTDNKQYNETITRTPADKIAILKEMQENIKSIYTMIFKDLECLFYQLV